MEFTAKDVTALNSAVSPDFSIEKSMIGFYHVFPQNAQGDPPLLLRPVRMGCGYCSRDFEVIRGRDYPYLTLHIVFSGCSFFQIDGGEYLLRKGDAFLILSGQEHRYCNINHADLGYLWIEMETAGCQEIVQWLRLQRTPVLDSSRTGPIFRQLLRTLRFVQQTGGGDAPALSGLCYMLLMRLCSARTAGSAAISLPACVVSALFYAGRHFAQTPSVSELAAYAHVSESCLTKQFRRCVGTSPAQYVLLKKTEQAVFLLKNTAFSCEQIAEQCGFYDSTHMSKVIARHIGISPSRIRTAGRRA